MDGPIINMDIQSMTGSSLRYKQIAQQQLGHPGRGAVGRAGFAAAVERWVVRVGARPRSEGIRRLVVGRRVVVA